MSKIVKQPIYTFEVTCGDKTYKIVLKHPTRSMQNEADMFYSIKLNEYIRMGLLTSEEMAKRQIDIGGALTVEQQKEYAGLQAILADKQEMLLRLFRKEELNDDQKEQKYELSKDVAFLRNKIADYEYIRQSVYEHTANAKARNDLILWWTLLITQVAEIKDGTDDLSFQNFFKGESHQTRQEYLFQLEDDNNEVYNAAFPELYKVVTLWCWMSVKNPDELKRLVKESLAKDAEDKQPREQPKEDTSTQPKADSEPDSKTNTGTVTQS